MGSQRITDGQFWTGRKSAIGTTALQLTATDQPCRRGVLIKAASGNTTVVYVGGAAVTSDAADATDGYPLAAGDSVGLEVDNANKVYVKGDGAGPAKVFYLAD